MVGLASPFRLGVAGARLLPLRRRRSWFSRHRVLTRCTPAEGKVGVTRKKQAAPISKRDLVAALVLVTVIGRIGAYICQKFNLKLPMSEQLIGVATTVLHFGKSVYKIVKDAKDIAELVMYIIVHGGFHIIKLYTKDSTGPSERQVTWPRHQTSEEEANPTTSEEAK